MQTRIPFRNFTGRCSLWRQAELTVGMQKEKVESVMSGRFQGQRSLQVLMRTKQKCDENWKRVQEEDEGKRAD